MCKTVLVLAASFALCVGFAHPAFAQQGKVNPTDSKRLAGMQRQNPTPPAKTVPEKKSDEPLSPAKQAAQDRVQQAWKQYQTFDDAVEVHERRIRTVRSIRVPPGVRPPQIDPVPQQLLQLRAQAWAALQEARRDFEQTR
jgi:hypothetical protein